MSAVKSSQKPTVIKYLDDHAIQTLYSRLNKRFKIVPGTGPDNHPNADTDPFKKVMLYLVKDRTSMNYSIWAYGQDGWVKSGISPELLNAKADKVVGAVAGNLAALDANGNIVDSGIPSIGTDKSIVIVTARKNAYDIFVPDRSFSDLKEMYDAGIMPVLRIFTDVDAQYAQLEKFDGAFKFKGAQTMSLDEATNVLTITNFIYEYSSTEFKPIVNSYKTSQVDIDLTIL